MQVKLKLQEIWGFTENGTKTFWLYIKEYLVAGFASLYILNFCVKALLGEKSKLSVEDVGK